MVDCARDTDCQELRRLVVRQAPLRSACDGAISDDHRTHPRPGPRRPARRAPVAARRGWCAHPYRESRRRRPSGSGRRSSRDRPRSDTVTDGPGAALEDVLRQPVPLRPATGVVLILDGAGRVVAAHLQRPPLRDGAGHVQRLGPAVLATWDDRLDGWEHFAWGVMPELAKPWASGPATWKSSRIGGGLLRGAGGGRHRDAGPGRRGPGRLRVAKGAH